MTVFRWIVRVLAVLGIGTIWWFTARDLNQALDAIAITQTLSKGVIGLVSTVLIAWLLTRKDA